MEVIDRIKDFFNQDDIGEPPWERNFSRVMSPDSILGAQTRSNKKSAGTLKNVNSNNIWRIAL